MKYILVIGDGMADNPVPELGGRTPLEAAKKPHIDALAEKSIVGSVLTVPKKQPPGSDTAILSIFGCDPNRYYTGRSPLEAAGSGMHLSPGDVSYRCNMVALSDGDSAFDDKTILSHNAGSIDGKTSIALIEWLFADPEFAEEAEKLKLTVNPQPSFRHIAVQKNGNINGMKAEPPHNILGSRIGEYAMAGNENAEMLWKLMALAAKKLEHHPLNEERRASGKLPANGIWFWAEGTAVALPNFIENYGHNGSVISAVPLVHGIGALTGLKMCTVDGATGETETNFHGKVQTALDELENGADFVCVHLEGPDEATHNGNLEEKLLCIEYLDERVVFPLTKALEERNVDFRLLLLSDHKTLMSTRTHDGDPVPYMLYDSTNPAPSGASYTEAWGEKGRYLAVGTDLMGLLFGRNV